VVAALSTISCTLSKNPVDPYEKLNRHTYNLNRGLDKAIVKPIATVYQTVLPDPIIKGLGNIFANINDVPTMANNILQGRIYAAWSDLWRIAINTTIGIGGFFDVASNIGLPKHKQDFGLTMAAWGYKPSAYFVIPIFGPSSIRDTIGMPVDRFIFSPYSYMPGVSFRNWLYGVNLVSQRASLLPLDKLIKAGALDPYQFERDAYLQYRKAQIEKNEGESVLPPKQDFRHLYLY
jgi:phospholipid-binding lipoprotein MlaA